MKEGNVPEKISVAELLREKATDEFCPNFRNELESGSPLAFSEILENRILDQILSRNRAVIVEKSLQSRFQRLEYEPLAAGRFVGRKLSYFMQMRCYWPRIAVH